MIGGLRVLLLQCLGMAEDFGGSDVLSLVLYIYNIIPRLFGQFILFEPNSRPVCIL
jgi:hypothetical protein